MYRGVKDRISNTELWNRHIIKPDMHLWQSSLPFRTADPDRLKNLPMYRSNATLPEGTPLSSVFSKHCCRACSCSPFGSAWLKPTNSRDIKMTNLTSAGLHIFQVASDNVKPVMAPSMIWVLGDKQCSLKKRHDCQTICQQGPWISPRPTMMLETGTNFARS